jgi:hypothetical protein
MLDKNEVPIEVHISHDGKVIWVNVEGKCAVRVNAPTRIVIQDDRKSTEELKEAVSHAVSVLYRSESEFTGNKESCSEAAFKLRLAFHDYSKEKAGDRFED